MCRRSIIPEQIILKKRFLLFAAALRRSEASPLLGWDHDCQGWHLPCWANALQIFQQKLRNEWMMTKLYNFFCNSRVCISHLSRAGMKRASLRRTSQPAVLPVNFIYHLRWVYSFSCGRSVLKNNKINSVSRAVHGSVDYLVHSNIMLPWPSGIHERFITSTVFQKSFI